ncbi:hypothetical protein Drose_06395 [Dactylosporangium roseum]|uniref:Uncharacterized protein n=1 Tax=Dactylosporangium roseum TaxID=47989 RepID=A0ABY5ZAR4_9ACTN|nr:hypothetical protein [Dactylosporangium roseum]UWZ37902.1 hypothetical protein Drose_06395 [Dactylosporangium roseum]
MPLSDEKERAVLLMQEGNARWMGDLTADDRRALTAPARHGWLQQLMQEIDPDGTLPPAEVEFRARQRRREIMARISRLGVEERLRKKAERERQAAAAALGALADAMAEHEHLTA